MDYGHWSVTWQGSVGTAYLCFTQHQLGPLEVWGWDRPKNHARASCTGKTRRGQLEPRHLSLPHGLQPKQPGSVCWWLFACLCWVLFFRQRPCCWPNSMRLRMLAQGSQGVSPERVRGGKLCSFLWPSLKVTECGMWTFQGREGRGQAS